METATRTENARGRKARAAASKAARTGRRGIPNREYLDGDLAPSRCPKCGSTDRGPYTRRREYAASRNPAGHPCTHVVLRWTQCANPNCKQHRVDRAFENRVAADEAA